MLTVDFARHLQIRSIDRSIATLEQSLMEVNDPYKKVDMLREIARLRKEKELACQGNSDGDNEVEEEDGNNWLIQSKGFNKCQRFLVVSLLMHELFSL